MRRLLSTSRRKESKLPSNALRSSSRTLSIPLSVRSCLPLPLGAKYLYGVPRKPGPCARLSNPMNGGVPFGPSPCTLAMTEPMLGQPPVGCALRRVRPVMQWKELWSLA